MNKQLPTPKAFKRSPPLEISTWYNVARFQGDSLAFLELGKGPAFGEQVINDDVARTEPQIRSDLARERRAKAPRRRKLRVVKHRAVELHRLQHFRQNIQAEPPIFVPDSQLRTTDGGTR
jgi:hypothetical protein